MKFIFVIFFLINNLFAQNNSFTTAFWKSNAAPSCPAGYQYVNPGTGAKCYSQLSGPATDTAAFNDCNTNGAVVSATNAMNLCPLLSGGCAAIATEKLIWKNSDGAGNGTLSSQTSTTYTSSVSYSGNYASQCSAFYGAGADTCDGTHYYFCSK